MTEKESKMFFHQVNEAQPDPIFGLAAALAADTRPQKVNLMVGIYKDEHLRAEWFSSIRMAKEQSGGQELPADYLPIDGLSELIGRLGPVVFGEAAWAENQGRIYGAHTAGGTGALRAGVELLAQEVGKTIYIPHYTWPNHRAIAERIGCRVETYPYYNHEKWGFDFDAMAACLEKLSPKTVVVLHACCHNPTGCDPNVQEWKELSLLMKEKKLLPFFDFAYQGLGDGVEKDAEAVRLFLREGHEMLIAYSCSKNFSMYCHRVGALFAVTENAAVKHRVGSQLKKIIRALYSNPPAYGAWIVNEVLKQDDLRKQWLKDLEGVRHRLTQMRESLVKRLIAQAKERDFRYVQEHKGMFSFLDLDKSQVQKLIETYAIYVLDSGRINVAGLTSENIDAVVKGVLAVCEEQ